MALILLVEDDPLQVKLLINALKPMNCDIAVAHEAETGIQLTHEHYPDLILMDLALPVMSGIEAIRIIRNDPRIAHIPIVVITARAVSDYQQAAWEAGCDAFLLKPFSMQEFRSVVQEFLEREH